MLPPPNREKNLRASAAPLCASAGTRKIPCLTTSLVSIQRTDLLLTFTLVPGPKCWYPQKPLSYDKLGRHSARALVPTKTFVLRQVRPPLCASAGTRKIPCLTTSLVSIQRTDLLLTFTLVPGPKCWYPQNPLSYDKLGLHSASCCYPDSPLSSDPFPHHSARALVPTKTLVLRQVRPPLCASPLTLA